MPGRKVVSRFRLCAVMAVALLALPMAGTGAVMAAEGGTAVAKTQVEAWYTTIANDTCEPPANLDCSALPAAEVYPKDTLHVGVSSGKRSAVTVFELDMFDAGIPPGMEIVGGKLSLPVDTAPGDGSLRHDAAKLLVCHVSGFVFGTAGALDKPPKADCDAASAPATYQAEPKPVFTADLTPFAAQWAKGDSPVIALIPAPDAESGGDTWHVTFWGKENESEGAVPISAELRYQPEVKDALPPPPPPLDTGEIAAPPPIDELPEPPPAEPLDAAAPEVGEAPAEAKPVAEKELEAPPQALPEQTWRTVGYPYPIAWTMPLLLLIGLTATGRALTKKLEPAPGMRLKW